MKNFQITYTVVAFWLLIFISAPATADICDADPNCDRMQVPGNKLPVMTAMGWDGLGFSTDLSPEVGEISSDMVELILRSLPRNPYGNDNVSCQDILEIRTAECSRQVAPHISYLRIGEAVVVEYGNGEREICIVVSKFSSIKAYATGVCN